jgi:hypothetical protein
MERENVLSVETAYVVLLCCLQDLDEDWRRIQLVNRAMCAAYRLYIVQVDEYWTKREQLRKKVAEARELVNDFFSWPYDTYITRMQTRAEERSRLWAYFHEHEEHVSIPVWTMEPPAAISFVDLARFQPDPWVDQVLFWSTARWRCTVPLSATLREALRLV